MTYSNLSLESRIEPWITISCDYLLQELQSKDILVIPVTLLYNSSFDDKLANAVSGMPIIVLDMLEYGWSVSWKNEHILGVNDNVICVPKGATPSRTYLSKLSEWLSTQNIICYFKREYSRFIDSIPTKFPIYPIELIPAKLPKCSLKQEQWLNRKGKVFYTYGYSHEDRKALHAGLQPLLPNNTVNCIEHAKISINKNLPFSILQEIPSFARYPYSDLLTVQSNCRVSPAPPGAGVKCFRNIESSYLSVPAVPDLGFKWTYPWTPNNSILLPTDEEGRIDIIQACSRINYFCDQDPVSTLEIAYKAVDNCNAYNIIEYNQNYLIPTVRKYI